MSKFMDIEKTRKLLNDVNEMTNEEAIQIINTTTFIILGGESEEQKFNKALIKSIETMEKQMPKKPLTGTDITTYDNWTLLPLICPCCSKQVGTIEAYTKLRDIKEHFCSKCGQAIDWSTENEN